MSERDASAATDELQGQLRSAVDRQWGEAGQWLVGLDALAAIEVDHRLGDAGALLDALAEDPDFAHTVRVLASLAWNELLLRGIGEAGLP